jgi:2-amino-4-hydroxy-6-hydroxymethyldihydropteridine diphosphokinase
VTAPRAGAAVVWLERSAVWAAPTVPESVSIGLGSNQGDRLDHLRRALFALLTHPEIRVHAVSPVYETEYVGPGRQADYLNACVEVKTRLAPKVLLSVLKGTEQRLGRAPGGHLRPRIIDLDILLYDQRVISTAVLVVPHPLMHERWFVLRPLAEFAFDGSVDVGNGVSRWSDMLKLQTLRISTLHPSYTQARSVCQPTAPIHTGKWALRTTDRVLRPFGERLRSPGFGPRFLESHDRSWHQRDRARLGSWVSTSA